MTLRQTCDFHQETFYEQISNGVWSAVKLIFSSLGTQRRLLPQFPPSVASRRTVNSPPGTPLLIHRPHRTHLWYWILVLLAARRNCSLSPENEQHVRSKASVNKPESRAKDRRDKDKTDEEKNLPYLQVKRTGCYKMRPKNGGKNL